MPFAIQNYPAWAITWVRISRMLSYAFATMTGVAAVVFTPASITPQTVVIISTMAIFGLVCLIGTTIQNYVVEWISLFFLTAGISVYMAGLWVGAVSNTKYIAAASLFTMLVLLLVVRLVDLTVYWLKIVKVAVIQKELADDDR
jgi:hypothetical protein